MSMRLGETNLAARRDHRTCQARWLGRRDHRADHAGQALSGVLAHSGGSGIVRAGPGPQACSAIVDDTAGCSLLEVTANCHGRYRMKTFRRVAVLSLPAVVLAAL